MPMFVTNMPMFVTNMPMFVSAIFIGFAYD